MEFFIVLGVVSVLGNPLYAEAYGFNMLPAWAVVLVALAVYAFVFAFKAVGLFVMAKRAGRQKLLWCAFVPFASTFLLGELAGDIRVGNGRLRHIGLYALIAEILLCVCYGIQNFTQMYIFSQGRGVLYNILTEAGSNGGTILSLEYTAALADGIVKMMDVAYILEYVLLILYTVVAVFMFIAFFKRYSPASYVWMVILCAVVPVATAFLVFAYRNRVPVDYDKLMAARAEHYRRMQASQYGGYPYGQPPYGGNPYGQPPYGAPGGQDAPPKAPDDPFGEFGSSSGPSGGSPEDDPFGEFSAGDKKEPRDPS